MNYLKAVEYELEFLTDFILRTTDPEKADAYLRDRIRALTHVQANQGVNPEAIIKFYGAIIETMVKGTDHVSVGVKPSADAMRVTMQMTAVEDSLLAEILVPADQEADGSMSGRTSKLTVGSILKYRKPAMIQKRSAT